MTVKEMRRELLVLLGRVSLTEGFSPEEVEKLLDCSQVALRRYKAGQEIFSEGDRPERLYLLLEGRVEILKNTYSGRQLMLGEVDEPGDMFGEVYLFLRHQAYDMYTRAANDVALLELTGDVFHHVESEDMALSMKLQYNLLRVIATKAYFMHNKLKVLSSGSLREKIARFIFQLPRQGKAIRLPYSREMLAMQLAVARPSLSRELGKMQQEGIIALEGESIQIADVEKFEELL